MSRRTLVAGVGNIFLSDDGFGVEVARRLAERGPALPAGVEVADFGIRGVHLAYQLMDGYDGLVLVDAMPRGDPPGTVYVMEPDLTGVGVDPADDTPGPVGVPDAHSMDPGTVLALLATVNGGAVPVERVVVVGCEPATVEDGIGLSPAVSAAVEQGVEAVLDVLSAGPAPPVRGGG
ncbi:MAG: hydrogenase maturation protease [Actinomycetes bacterium]